MHDKQGKLRNQSSTVFQKSDLKCGSKFPLGQTVYSKKAQRVCRFDDSVVEDRQTAIG
jgi:hypothetical protein